MKTARQLSVFVLLTAGIIALYGGIRLIIDPSGYSLGFPFYLLNGTIFSDYSLMGWTLAVTVGLSGVLISVCILRKGAHYSFFLMVQGVVICVYVAIMIILLGEAFPVEYFYLISGIALIGLGALQHQRKIVVESERKVSNPAVKSHHHKHRRR